MKVFHLEIEHYEDAPEIVEAEDAGVQEVKSEVAPPPPPNPEQQKLEVGDHPELSRHYLD